MRHDVSSYIADSTRARNSGSGGYEPEAGAVGLHYDAIAAIGTDTHSGALTPAIDRFGRYADGSVALSHAPPIGDARCSMDGAGNAASGHGVSRHMPGTP